MHRFLLLVLVLFLLVGCGKLSTEEDCYSPSGDECIELEKAQLLLAAKGNAMYYAYVASEKGFFIDEGLDVELISMGGGSQVVKELGPESAGIGIVAVSSILPAWNENQDIQVVFQMNSTNLFDLIVEKGSSISTILDLKGKVIGVTDLGGAEVQMAHSLLASAGLKVNQDVTFRAIGNDPDAIRTAIDKGEIAAYSGGAHDLAALYETDFQSTSLTPRNYKSLPSTAIIASGKVVKERPDLIEKMSRAIARGIDYSIKNRKDVLMIMEKASPEEYENKTAGLLALDTFIDLSTPIETDKGYGYIYRNSWEKLIQLYNVGEEPIISKEINLDQYLNTSFLEKVNEFEK